VLINERVESTVLPFDYWSGLEGNSENLAYFVRPKLADCDRVIADAAEQLKKWKMDAEINGYTLADKNKIRQITAAIFMSIKHLCLEKSEQINLSFPTLAGCGSVVKERKVNALQLAIFAAACLERAKLHPVLMVGKEQVACGVWLYDSCSIDSVGDDMQLISKYVSSGINNLSFFDVEDLFDNKSIGYPTAEVHFTHKLQSGAYENFIDIRRCRIDNLRPLPLRTQGLKGYELISEKEMGAEAPASLPEMRKLSLDGKVGKNKQWERRLLDLSLKNTLLSFDVRRYVLHLASTSVDETYSYLTGAQKTVSPTQHGHDAFKDTPFFGASVHLHNKKDLVRLEQENGIFRVFSDAKSMNESLSYLVRRGREANEESGTRILYAAFGFLKWKSKEDGKDKFAPLVLQPVTITKNRGSDTYTLVAMDEEFSVNATLLEFLKQEFNVDIRGLGGDVSALKISEILAMVKMEIIDKKGWDVYDDVYLAAFSFARYLMWNDVRKNIDEFKKNPLISSLLNNRNELEESAQEDIDEDQALPASTLTPLPADSSQYEAIALSQTGKTFVLHGPPGTGKSQTITNMIANALNDNKRVLFVAEKQAALDVVKKRLDAIGIGDFCLELHANKTDKSEVVKRIESTLALAREPQTEEEQVLSQEQADYKQSAESITELKKHIQNPLSALHKKRRLGVSIYEALLIYLKNKNAPEILNIESTFYDSLTEQKLKKYEGMLVNATAAAKECGGVYNSPFEKVNLSEYSQEIRDAVYCACEVVLTEIKHLKNYLGLFLELYRQRISTFTRKKIELLRELVAILSSGALNPFFEVDEAEFYVFFNANKRLDSCLEYYYKHFKTLIDIRKEYPTMGAALENWSGSYYTSKELSEVMKKLSRVAYGKISDEDAKKFLETVYDIYSAQERIKKNTALSKNFLTLFGGIDFKKRAEYLKELYHMHEICATLFMDYNADSFNSMCHRAVCGYTMPVLEGLMQAVDCFERAEERFCQSIRTKKETLAGDDLLDFYTAKAGALIDNIDMLASWCSYTATANELEKCGLKFIVDALESGRIFGENIISAFRKNIYRNFLDIHIPADPVLSRFSAAVLEETVEQFRLTYDKFNELAQNHIRSNLISRLPSPNTDGSLSLELITLTRTLKGKMRGMGIRNMLQETPELMKVVAPCMLMSPLTVSQYLQPTADFDLVIFDEASQLPTCEAIGALARAKSAVVVGDPKQLPPTAFFSTTYVDEENLESEDMESILEDCLALGIPERSLTWHYRSKHESLIAFSNHMYYDSKLCTFPSPDALDSKVRLELVENGVYDRGATKRNDGEAAALIAEVIRRLKNPVLSRSSMGIVTFSSVQKEYIERKLTRAIADNGLEEVAYEREEPLFVKNLENVQGDERDVILFSVCYGPDRQGRVSLNFGPLNQAGGWRRLNVAVSRAREEMVIFSSMTSAFIDLSRTNSKGVAGLKAFLEFAQKGRTTLALNSARAVRSDTIGKYVAEELSSYGYDCRQDVGASNFKIDVAVVDPKNKSRFILAIVMDASTQFSVKDRNVLQIRTLKRNNWNVLRLYSVNYYNNPKREIKKIKECLDRLTGAEKRGGSALSHAKRLYKQAKIDELAQPSAYVLELANDEEIISRLKRIVIAEEPISLPFLKKRCLATLGITKWGVKVDGKIEKLIESCAFKEEKVLGEVYYRKSDKANAYERYRVEEGEPLRKSETDFTPYETVALIRSALEDKVALYVDEIIALVCATYRIYKPTDKMTAFINACISLGEKQGWFLRSVSDRISLA
ncbi:MAG: DUF4011 domain-containing protein, partial [Clostridia bacterium]|nr:DUF4011 domain-containing protein [Clostridia bacterium]